jgi:hypothetical protein
MTSQRQNDLSEAVREDDLQGANVKGRYVQFTEIVNTGFKKLANIYSNSTILNSIAL